ncbi:polyprenyl synthetase family protein [Deltaproteobacteria bacterium Smac51]|nr:polyprenyl synthetase family protein [Deltaproteobacteria bacterium Smac51]
MLPVPASGIKERLKTHMADILTTLAPLIERINETMTALIARDEEVVARIGDYSFSGGGKRLRPLMFCLVSEALGRQVTDEVLETSTAFEFLHMATLLHDDIIDGAEVRRGREATHLVYGVPETVLAGDYLLAKAAGIGADTGHISCVRILSAIVGSMSLGELVQLEARHRADLSEDEYFRIIYRKTAALMEGSAHSAAVLAGVDEALAGAALEYGCKLGLAFQIMDDILDYQSDEETFGKPVGHDLIEGKITLPFIRARGFLRDGDREALRKLADGSFDPADWPEVMRLVTLGRGVASARRTAEELAAEAAGALSVFPPSSARDQLADLAIYMVARDR